MIPCRFKISKPKRKKAKAASVRPEAATKSEKPPKAPKKQKAKAKANGASEPAQRRPKRAAAG